MKILFDTNVILDVLLDREPFAESFEDSVIHEAARLVSAKCIVTRDVTGFNRISVYTPIEFIKMMKTLEK